MNNHQASVPRRSFLRTCAVTGAGLAAGLHRGLLKAAARPARGKLANETIVVGLDIGSSNVCAAVAERRSDGTIRLLGVGEAPCYASKWGLVDSERTRGAVLEALVDAETKADVMIGSAALALKAGPKGRLRNPWAILEFVRHCEENEALADALFESETWSDIYRIVDYAREQEEILLRDLDGEHLEPRGAGVEFWNDEPLVVEIIQAALAPVATADALLSPEYKRRGALVIDLGAGTTEFCVATGDFVYPDTVQVGGKYIAIDVPSEMVSRLRHVETLVEEVGAHRRGVPAISEKRPCPTLERIDPLRLTYTFELIKARLDKAGFRLASLHAGIHLTGGYSASPVVREFAEWIFGVPAQMGRVQGIAGPATLLANARHACAIGLAKRSYI